MKPVAKCVVALAGMAVFAVLLLYSADLRAGVLYGLELASSRVIPSLFLFAVASELFLRFRLDRPIRNAVGVLFERTLGLPRCAASSWVIGIVAGYPLGGKAVADLCASGELTREEGERAISLCSSCGIAYTVAVVRPILGLSAGETAILYGIHLVSGLLAFLPFRRKRQMSSGETDAQFRDPPRFAPAFAEAVGSAAFTMVKLTGFLCVFCAVSRLLPIVPAGLLELSAGIDGLRHGQTVFAALYMGLGGICVWCQTAAVIGSANLRLGRFCLCKSLQAILSAGMAYLVLS